MDAQTKIHDVIVIGGGQAGLTCGYYLAQAGLRFLILDGSRRVGDAWRRRWDSLRLFTPSRFNALPGLPWPGGRGDVVTKDEMADYLERYAEHHRLPVQLSTRVTRLTRHGACFRITGPDVDLLCRQVIVAMSNYQVPWRPEFAEELAPGTFQIHSKHYRNPDQLRAGPVLVVGGGNSAADIALELSAEHETTMAGTESGHIPFRIEPFIARHLLISLVRFVGHWVLNLGTPLGRRLRPTMLKMAAPLVRVKPRDLLAAGVRRVPRVVGVRDGKPVLADGEVVDVDSVVWCTGYRPGFDWIDLPVLDHDREPIHDRGIVGNVPGLYFVGLHFQFAATSDTVTGVARDARFVVRHVAERARRGGLARDLEPEGVANVA